ncbi:hypothetical protein PNA2_1459 [Pyrococcus sp. NA2]|uniref:hypothetical protein n=1 Tax=Pyrococcus sp. (strain NA2) TaxID=342949 RepID=UPI000209AF92|nr:hypothetical protein [Pyrococcus sp. NA2]AEC52374.1 hypothetical protein PNA2_1459 [Pyrococcus sp. NA2]
MEEVRELKDVLERVEAKLIATFHIYTALIYSAWTLAVGGSLLITLFKPDYLGYYWLASIMAIFILVFYVYRKYIPTVEGENKEGYAWIVGWIVGGILYGILGDPRGLASMIISGHIGMAISFREESMLIPLLLILVFLKPNWTFASYMVVVTYSAVATFNLYKAFKVI